MMNLALSVQRYSRHQRDMYLPVLLQNTKSPDKNVVGAALAGLWALRDVRAASVIADLVNDPHSLLNPGERKMFSRFVQHCQTIGPNNENDN